MRRINEIKQFNTIGNGKKEASIYQMSSMDEISKTISFIKNFNSKPDRSTKKLIPIKKRIPKIEKSTRTRIKKMNVQKVNEALINAEKVPTISNNCFPEFQSPFNIISQNKEEALEYFKLKKKNKCISSLQRIIYEAAKIDIHSLLLKAYILFGQVSSYFKEFPLAIDAFRNSVS